MSLSNYLTGHIKHLDDKYAVVSVEIALKVYPFLDLVDPIVNNVDSKVGIKRSSSNVDHNNSWHVAKEYGGWFGHAGGNTSVLYMAHGSLLIRLDLAPSRFQRLYEQPNKVTLNGIYDMVKNICNNHNGTFFTENVDDIN